MAFTTAVDDCELRHDDRWLGFYESVYFQIVVWIFGVWWLALSLWAAYNLGRVIKGWWLRRKVGGKVVVAFTYGCLLPACVLRVLYVARFLHTTFTDTVILCDSEGFPWFVVIRNIFYSLLLIVFSGLCLFWVALDGLIANARDSEVRCPVLAFNCNSASADLLLPHCCQLFSDPLACIPLAFVFAEPRSAQQRGGRVDPQQPRANLLGREHAVPAAVGGPRPGQRSGCG